MYNIYLPVSQKYQPEFIIFNTYLALFNESI